ncbi:DUF1801 domain-containing protein [Gymnodinialimonas hymeniacidonis]|uniref:DUF1801 domain-containing protein n=1 Tax=Gymnodinialimonas hymeniacidonis TaxID=3126508 RepID=UPI0034C6D093
MDSVTETYQAFKGLHGNRLLEMRDLIFAAADATNTAPLTETLKWGQPAYLPAKRAGTTVRLGADAEHPAMFVHCQTDLVSRYRVLFPTEFTYSGNRAVRLPASGPYSAAAFQQIAAMALTYHRDKR